MDISVILKQEIFQIDPRSHQNTCKSDPWTIGSKILFFIPST